jgi:hypothetical protein
MASRGRRAVLPPTGPGTERGLLLLDGRTVVRCFEEETGEHKDFDLTGLPLAPELLAELAAAFERRTAPGRGPTRIATFEQVDKVLRRFAEYLATLAWPPAKAAHLTAEHIDGFLVSRSRYVNGPKEVADLKLLLAKVEVLSEAMLGVLGEPNPKRHRAGKRPGYTAAEFGRIAAAARADLRAAAARIRGNRVELERLRAGVFDPCGDRMLTRRMKLLEWVEQRADVPRYAPAVRGAHLGHSVARAWVFEYGPIADIIGWLHLSSRELAAATVLMAAMTGENKSVLLATPAAHHRADGYTGRTGVVITGGRKHRRGRRSHMDLVWSEVPDWISIPEDPATVSAKDELHTPFGLYMLLHELAAGSRVSGATEDDDGAVTEHGDVGSGHS